MATSAEPSDGAEHGSRLQTVARTAAAALDQVLVRPDAANQHAARIAMHAWLAAAELRLREITSATA